jgi:hypothetical protein
MSFSMDERLSFAPDVVRAFNKYWKWKLPAPVDPMAYVYRAAYGDKEWAAMRYLYQKDRDLFSLQKSFSLFIPLGDSRSAPHIEFYFGGDKMYPVKAVFLGELPVPVADRLVEWANKVNHYRSLQDELRRRCDGIMGNPSGEGDGWVRRYANYLDPKLNTPGQVYTLWPEIQPFLPTKWKHSVRQSTKKSRLPKYVGYRLHRPDYAETYWATPMQFRAEDANATDEEKRRFAEINEILLLVSLAYDVPTPKLYPTFHMKPDTNITRM